jgi:hypothetical protein
MHSLSDFNAYTGVLLGMCFLAVASCWIVLANIASTLTRFHQDYRKVNRLDEREKFESYP